MPSDNGAEFEAERYAPAPEVMPPVLSLNLLKKRVHNAYVLCGLQRKSRYRVGGVSYRLSWKSALF